MRYLLSAVCNLERGTELYPLHNVLIHCNLPIIKVSTMPTRASRKSVLLGDKNEAFQVN